MARSEHRTNTTSGEGTFRYMEHAAQPEIHQRGREIQPYGVLTKMPIGIKDSVRAQSVENLNQLLADTIMLRDMYKKHHWQVSGPTFYQLHKMFDKHFEAQSELVDQIAERVQMLGGLALGMPHDVAENTRIEKTPRGREDVATQISRLVEAHGQILEECHQYCKEANDGGDDGTNDLIVSDIMRTNEFQLWFLSEHLVDEPLARTMTEQDNGHARQNGRSNGRHRGE